MYVKKKNISQLSKNTISETYVTFWPAVECNIYSYMCCHKTTKLHMNPALM